MSCYLRSAASKDGPPSFIYIQKYQNIYKSSGKTVIINSIDHKFKQYPPYQNGKRCDQHRLQEDTEF